MNMIKYIIAVVPSIIFIIFGICIKYYKAYWLISGYNTMSDEKKKKVDVERLGKMMGNFCFVLAGLIFTFILLLLFEKVTLSVIIGVILMGSIIYFLIKAQKFDGNAVESNGKLKRSTKIITGSVIAFLVIVLSGVGLLLYQSSQPATYIILEEAIKINGLYGETIYFKDIDSITLSEEIPRITIRTNGSAIGSTLKGHFKVEGIGDVKLFIDNSKIPPFIFIETGGRTIILNSGDKAKTQEFFRELEAR